MIFVGDVHGKFNRFFDIVDSTNDDVVQLGDFGLGFNFAVDKRIASQMKQRENVTFIRGNHDNVDVCRQTPGFLGDGLYFKEHDLFAIGGAWSIDKEYRKPNVDWWETEELEDEEFQKAFDVYMQTKPRIMLTHDCPKAVSKRMFFDSGLLASHFNYPSHMLQQYENRTASWLDKFFKYHQPELWFFGHWHIDSEMVMEGTQFRCLAELSTFSL